MNAFKHAPRRPLGTQIGLTLVELMVAMVIGLVLIGGVTSIILANSQAYRINEGLSQVQESARTAFELLARDIREAGRSDCGDTELVVNVLNEEHWWDTAWSGIVGYEDSDDLPESASISNRAPGTDAILLRGMADAGVVVENHDAAGSAQFKIDTPTDSFGPGSIVMVCGPDHSAIFQVTHYNSQNRTVGHNTGQETPGNCTQRLGHPTPVWPDECAPQEGTLYSYPRGAMIANFSAVIWYIGNNGRPGEDGRSLYRYSLASGVQEIVPGVSNMQLAYRANNNAATLTENPTDWNDVTAVEITLTTLSADANISTAPNTFNGRLWREFTSIIGLRNRLP